MLIAFPSNLTQVKHLIISSILPTFYFILFIGNSQRCTSKSLWWKWTSFKNTFWKMFSTNLIAQISLVCCPFFPYKLHSPSTTIWKAGQIFYPHITHQPHLLPLLERHSQFGNGDILMISAFLTCKIKIKHENNNFFKERHLICHYLLHLINITVLTMSPRTGHNILLAEYIQ